MAFFKHILKERLSCEFQIQLLRAHNIRGHFRDCASVTLRRNHKRYTTKLAIVDGIDGGVVWNEAFQIQMTLYRPRKSQIFESKRFSLRVLAPSTDPKMGDLKCVLDFAHFANLEIDQEVKLTLPLISVSKSSTSSTEAQSVHSLMENSNFSPSAVLSRSQVSGKPSIVLRITRKTLGSGLVATSSDEHKEMRKTLSGFEIKSAVSNTVQLEPLLETTISHQKNNLDKEKTPIIAFTSAAISGAAAANRDDILSKALQVPIENIQELDGDEEDPNKQGDRQTAGGPLRSQSTSTEHELRLAESMSGQDMFPMQYGRPGGRLGDAFRSSDSDSGKSENKRSKAAY